MATISNVWIEFVLENESVISIVSSICIGILAATMYRIVHNPNAATMYRNVHNPNAARMYRSGHHSSNKETSLYKRKNVIVKKTII